MQLYLIEQGWFPSELEGVVILAKSKEDAIRVAGLEDKVIVKDIDEIDDEDEEKYISIKEIDITKEQVIYAGNYCC